MLRRWNAPHRIAVRTGGVIPVDGLVREGKITVDQASLTGASIPLREQAKEVLSALGMEGVLPPVTSATRHNLSTLGVGLRSMSRMTDRNKTLQNNQKVGLILLPACVFCVVAHD